MTSTRGREAGWVGVDAVDESVCSFALPSLRAARVVAPGLVASGVGGFDGV